jgi:hypothetical protein
MSWKEIIKEAIQNNEGVIISDGGTCNPSYVIPRLLNVLFDLNVNEYTRLNEEYDKAPLESEEMDFIYEEIFDTLQDNLPDGAILSSHPGDSTTIGIWPAADFDE